MKKGFFCDEVLRSLTGGSYSVSDFKFERRDVAAHLDGAIAAVVKANFFENYKLGDRGLVDSGFTTTYEDVEVKYSDSRAIYYSDLPTLPIALERGLGVAMVAPMQDEGSALIPLSLASSSMHKGLPSDNMFNIAAYRLQGKRIYYRNLMPKGSTAPSEYRMLIIMISSTLGLSMDAEIPMPADYYPQVHQAAISAMVGPSQIKQDSVMDSNSSTK